MHKSGKPASVYIAARIAGGFMGLCFSFISNDSELFSCALDAYHSLLTLPEGAPNGWGLGYYQAGQPLLRKQPKSQAGPLDFTTISANVKTNCLMGHVRQATLGGQRTENTHPFRFRTWIFCHLGTIECFEHVREDMLRSIPDFIRRNIRGKTDSEHLFHLFLSFLNDTGKMDDPRIPMNVAAQSLASTFAYVDRLVADHGGCATNRCAMVSNGNILLATHTGNNLKIKRKSGYSCSNKEGKPLSTTHLKTVMIMGGHQQDHPGWEDVIDQTIVSVDHNLNIEYSEKL